MAALCTVIEIKNELGTALKLLYSGTTFIGAFGNSCEVRAVVTPCVLAFRSWACKNHSICSTLYLPNYVRVRTLKSK